MSKTIRGFGINDVENFVIRKEKINGKYQIVWRCPYYQDWVGVIERCLSSDHHIKRPTYSDCTVCEEWKYLSNFIKWVDSQPNRNWMNCPLDKDLLITGNKHYSPETCVYIPQNLNTFTLSCDSRRGQYMIGAYFDRDKNKFVGYCNNPSLCRKEHIGYFSTEIEAHKAWQAKKHEHALRLADEQQDPRVAKALRERYAPDKDWTNK